jgi:glucose-6-phosphate dehydrogenase assembly protein OpcA
VEATVTDTTVTDTLDGSSDLDLGRTTTGELTRRLRALREERGEVATGRVLTLIVSVRSEEDLDAVVAATNEASREHPARVIIVIHDRSTDRVSMDARIRLGGEAGASEVILLRLHGGLADHADNVVMPLLLPDTPVVVWWPFTSPRNPAGDALGALATRRITDSFADAAAGKGSKAIFRRRIGFSRGDSDLVWSRITQWRGLLASALDQRPGDPVEAAEITGPAEDPAVDIAAGWLADRLDITVTRQSSGAPAVPLDAEGRPTPPIQRAVLHCAGGDLVMEVTDHRTVRVDAGDGTSNIVTLHRRTVGECLAEELRHLEPDTAFGDALHGLPRVHIPRDRVDPAAFSEQASPR